MLGVVEEVIRTTTAEAVLGWLSFRPMSGYEIRGYVDEATGNFWKESFGQIYPTLKRLREEGLVELVEMGHGTVRREAGRPDSKTYRITAAGKERLGRWLETPSREQVPRNELLLKIFFCPPEKVEVVREQVRGFRGAQERDLARYDGMEAEMRRVRGQDSRMPLWLMTLRYGQAETQALLAWADEALRMCDAMEAGRPV